MPVCRALLAVLALLVLPASAAALPPDPPVTPLTPADGATVPVNADGIPVTYSCPVYKIDEPGGFALYGGPKDYSVGLSKSPQTGADGRLATMDAIVHANFTDPAVGPEGCSAALGAGAPLRGSRRRRARTTGRCGGCAPAARRAMRSGPCAR